jgi:hypothetical protein
MLGTPGFLSLGGLASLATDFLAWAKFCFLDFICLLSAMAGLPVSLKRLGRALKRRR